MPRLPLYTCALGTGGVLRWSEAAEKAVADFSGPVRASKGARRREKACTSEAASIVIVAAFGTVKPSLVAIATSGLENLHRNSDSLLYIYAYYAYNFGRKYT